MSDVTPEPAPPVDPLAAPNPDAAPAPEPSTTPAPDPVPAEPEPVRIAPETAPAPPDPAGDATATINQLNGQIAVLNERIHELATYQGQVRDLRDGQANLTEQLRIATEERDRALRDAAQAQAAVLSVSASVDADASKVAAAKALAEALRTLIG